jgi:hypothetical protein
MAGELLVATDFPRFADISIGLAFPGIGLISHTEVRRVSHSSRMKRTGETPAGRTLERPMMPRCVRNEQCRVYSDREVDHDTRQHNFHIQTLVIAIVDTDDICW